ncbi:MAG: hypothetical protein J6Y72_02375 [Bacteroidales bacterium]|nr:hypothetical protein [Bacteroidales bacterium]
MLRRCFIVIFTTLSFAVHAQFYTTGVDPLRTHWRSINTPHYRLVFADYQEAAAQATSLQLDTLYQLGYTTMGRPARKLNTLIHPLAAYSNGLVAWAPARAEFYNFSNDDGDCISWLSHLAIHEYRHNVQMSLLHQGFSRFLYGIFGEQIIGGVAGIYVPKWLLEGDAVATETALTHGGRGRKAAFMQDMHALIATGRTPTYDEAYFGSFRHKYPNYYHSGYLTVAASRLQYGADVWANAIANCGRKSFSLVPFNRSLRQQTGLRKVALYNDAMRYWQTLYSIRDASIPVSAYRNITPIITKPSRYCSYTSPQIHGDDIVAIRTSQSVVEDFVTINRDGKVRHLLTPSILNDLTFDLRGDTMVWTEYRQHLLWENAGWSPIIMYDFKCDKQRMVAKGRFSSPTISPDGNSIAAIRTDSAGFQYVCALSFNGDITFAQQLPITDNASSPQWLDNKHIAYIKTSAQGKSVEVINLHSKAIQVLVEPRFTNLRFLRINNEGITITDDAEGTDNIYTIEKGKLTRLTTARFGAAYGFIHNNRLIYSNYNDLGYAIVEADTSTQHYSYINVDRAIADSLARFEKGLMPALVDSSAHESNTYSRAHILGIHSWGPATVDASSKTVNSRMSIASQNLLGNTTLGVSIDYSGNTDELLKAELNYNALPVRIGVSATYGYSDYKFSGIISDSRFNSGYSLLTYDARSKKRQVQFTFSLPVVLNSGAWNRRITPYVAYDLERIDGFDYTAQEVVIDTRRNYYKTTDNNIYASIAQSNINDLQYGLYTHIMRRTAARDIGTRYGFALRLNYRHTPFATNYGSIKSAAAYLYLPGFVKHHNIVIYLAAQQKGMGESYQDLLGYEYHRYYGDNILRPRGCSAINNRELQTIRASYSLPIIDPDWSIGPIVYIKRIGATLFYDAARGNSCDVATNDSYSFTMHSTGVELFASTYWLRLPYPITIGIRSSYLPDTHKKKSEAIFGISF